LGARTHAKLPSVPRRRVQSEARDSLIVSLEGDPDYVGSVARDSGRKVMKDGHFRLDVSIVPRAPKVS
jgi:hypothetical protein